MSDCFWCGVLITVPRVCPDCAADLRHERPAPLEREHNPDWKDHKVAIYGMNPDGTVTEYHSDDHTGDLAMGDWSPTVNDIIQETE